eukprot:1060692-Amphidinium_carterae.1
MEAELGDVGEPPSGYVRVESDLGVLAEEVSLAFLDDPYADGEDIGAIAKVLHRFGSSCSVDVAEIFSVP